MQIAQPQKWIEPAIRQAKGPKVGTSVSSGHRPVDVSINDSSQFRILILTSQALQIGIESNRPRRDFQISASFPFAKTCR